MSNSILDYYFRERIGVILGEPVMLADLQSYGRVDLEFFKKNVENNLMDHS